MMAGIAAADVSWSVKANAGTSNTSGASTKSSGIDLNVSASVTTDSGVTVTFADDFGGEALIDWNDDNRVVPQDTDLDQPSVSVAMSNVSTNIDAGSISDLYDDSLTGDMQISTPMAGFSIDYVASSDTDTNTNSYKLGYPLVDLSISVAAKTYGAATENEAMKWSATYAMGNGLSVSLSADDNNDWTEAQLERWVQCL